MAFVVFAGVGALARAVLAGRANGPAFPWGTLLVNVSGAFLLGTLHGVRPPVATVVGVGAIGAYTTFSSFAADTVALVQRGRPLRAAVYIGVMLITGITAAAIGRTLST